MQPVSHNMQRPLNYNHNHTFDKYIIHFEITKQALLFRNLAAARLVTGLGRREHIYPPVLTWMAVRQPVILIHRLLAGTAPAYLSDECHPTSSVGVPSLRSTDSRTCLPRRAHKGCRVGCFAAASPRLWNSKLREPEILFNRFKTVLKTFLF